MSLKILEIFLKNGQIIKLEDKDPANINDYSNNLSALFDINNICVLQTSSGNCICRPSDVSMIFVQEKLEEVEQIKNKQPNVNIEENQEEDFIIDGE